MPEKRRKIKIITDSTSDLTQALLDEMNVSVVPLYVTFGNDQFRDGVDLKEPELYAKVEDYKALPKTAAPSVTDIQEMLIKYLDEGYDILYFSISSKMSISYSNAVAAAEQFQADRIAIINSMNLSTGIGLQVCAAYDLVQKGLSLSEIVCEIKQISTKIRTAFTVETLDYLYKGGRCNAIQALFSGMLQIRPIIKVVDGSMTVGAKVRGKKQKALDYMIDEAVLYREKILYGRIFITHTSGSEEEAKYIYEKLSKSINNVSIYITNAGCVIASHCGMKTIGILFIANEIKE